MMSSFQSDNFNRRRFQSTGFGLDRDVSCGDRLPAWKRQMFHSIRNKTKQHRDRLLQRLEQQRNQNQDLSPNSKKQNAINTIDSFKNSLIDHEIKQLKFNKLNMSNNNNSFGNNNNFGNNNQNRLNNNNFNMNNNQNNNQFNQYKNNNFGNLNGNSNHNGIGFGQMMNNNDNGYKQSNHFQQDEDIESANLSPEQYKAIFAELSRYLEETELSDLRQSVVASLEEFEKDQQDAQLQEILANDDYNNPHVVYCPICQKNTMHIEYINNHQPVYGCSCGIKFQARDKNVSIPKKMEQKNCGKDDEDDDDDDIDFCRKKINNNDGNKMKVMNTFQFNVENKENNWTIESDEEHGQRMLKSLKNNLNCLMNYHCQQFKCNQQLNFAVIDETGYLQAWCCQCNCNEIVI